MRWSEYRAIILSTSCSVNSALGMITVILNKIVSVLRLSCLHCIADSSWSSIWGCSWNFPMRTHDGGRSNDTIERMIFFSILLPMVYQVWSALSGYEVALMRHKRNIGFFIKRWHCARDWSWWEDFVICYSVLYPSNLIINISQARGRKISDFDRQD